MRVRRRPPKADAELDITSFMNLMIVLVPVLLLSMVFSQITVLDIRLPQTGNAAEKNDLKNQQLELVIREEQMRLFYPAGVLLKQFPSSEGAQDFRNLAIYLKELKRTLQQKDVEKRDIIILSEPEINYQTIVSAMDTVRSFEAVVAAAVVDAELFPAISLGDAPELARGGN